MTTEIYKPGGGGTSRYNVGFAVYPGLSEETNIHMSSTYTEIKFIEFV